MKVSDLFRLVFGFTFVFSAFSTPILYAYLLEYAPRYMVDVVFDTRERVVQQQSICLGIACLGLSILFVVIGFGILDCGAKKNEKSNG